MTPLFDFVCRDCGREFEALVRTGHPPVCPGCGGAELDRKLASFAVKSAERSAAAATANRKKWAKIGHQENQVLEAEAKHHRDEDH